MCVGCGCPQGLCANRKRSRGSFGWKVTKNKNKKPSQISFLSTQTQSFPRGFFLLGAPCCYFASCCLRWDRPERPPLCCLEHLAVPQMNVFSAVGLFYLRVHVLWLKAVYNLSFLSDCWLCCVHVGRLYLSLLITLLQISIFGDFGSSPVLVGLTVTPICWTHSS